MADEAILMARRTACRRLSRGAALAAAWPLFGCAAPFGATGDASGRALLEPVDSLSGAPLGTLQPSGFVNLIAPVALAARFDVLYVADRGTRQIYRYERAMRTLARFADFAAGTTTALAVAPDLSLYVADSSQRTVRHFASDGRAMRPIEDTRLLLRPVAVVPDPTSGAVWVADSHFKHLVLFNPFGAALTTVSLPGNLSVDGAAGGPHGLYLLDRAGKKVVVIGPDGVPRYSLGSGLLQDPLALAVDRFNRVFVADGFDGAIQVFEDQAPLVRFGASNDNDGSRLGLGQPLAFAIDRDTLYVADALPPAVHLYRVAPPRPEKQT